MCEINNKRPTVAPTAWVADSAHLSGDVVIDDNASIWFGAVLRGDEERIAIGAETNIQDGCVLHTDEGFPLTVGERVVVGHRAVLHGCTVKDGALIGIGAIVLNGAVVGEGAIVAAGALVTEGAVIPAGHLAVGVPAKVLRPVKDEEKKRIAGGADHYIRAKELYRR